MQLIVLALKITSLMKNYIFYSGKIKRKMNFKHLKNKIINMSLKKHQTPHYF